MTKGHVSSADGDRRWREARQWYSVHQSGRHLSAAALKKWVRWADDPDNGAEYDRFVRLCGLLRTLPPSPSLRDADLRAGTFEPPSEVAALSWKEKLPSLPEGLRAGSQTRRALIFTGGVAAGACVLAFITPHVLRRFNTPIAQTPVYETAVGENREVALRDGSVITLGGATVIKADATPQERIVYLERGEALFQVKRDPRRPFHVVAGVGRTTALGTAFDVRRYADSVRVTVTEGSVEVAADRARSAQWATAESGSSGEGAQWKVVRVTRGHEVSYNAKGDAGPVRPADLKKATAWREGALSYRGQALREVVEDAQRYSSLRLVLDSSAADLQYTGDISADDIEHWVRGLPRIFPVEVDDSSPDSLLIKCRSSARCAVP